MDASRSLRRLRVVGLVAVIATTAACNPFSSSSKNVPGPQVTVTSTHHTSKPIVVIHGYRTLRAGQLAQIGVAGQSGAALVTVGKPRIARGPLSSDYGYAPQHGYYVNFPIKMFDDGSGSVLVNRLDFWVQVPGQGKVNTNDGNSPVSGAHEQLDTTEIERGQSVSNFLAFDVSSPHGTFVYGPHGKPMVAWSY